MAAGISTIALAALTSPALAGAGPAAAAGPASPAAGTAHRAMHVCSTPVAGSASCDAIVVTGTAGQPLASGRPSGYGPADIQSAYNLGGAHSGGRTVAVVDAYNDPTAESDLAVYRSQFGLPACTTANGCFRKVNQTGGTSYPRTNSGWAQEISLDLDMVSAACPDCHILLVEASSASFANLSKAVSYAASVPGVKAISNSYGGRDASNRSAYEKPASHGIAVTASTGDAGYGVQSPASFTDVVAVGGTSLRRAGNARGWSESAWSGAGSGCSTINARPAWQTGTSCPKKASADVSAVADPNTGVAVYDSTAHSGLRGWLVFGGTSASSPIIASVYALAGNFGALAAKYTWTHAGALNDVTSGSNGSCPQTLWCHAAAGWDGPTGLGTPHGTGSF